MNKLKAYNFLLILCFFGKLSHSQDANDVLKICNNIKLGDKINLSNKEIKLKYEHQNAHDVKEKKYFLSDIYLKTFYGRKLQSVEIQVDEKSIVQGIIIEIAFDTTLHKEIEANFGKPDFNIWTSYISGIENKVDFIKDRRWILGDLAVIYRNDRYNQIFDRGKYTSYLYLLKFHKND